MNSKSSVRFFDEQFQRQVVAGDVALNPFESAALPHLHGEVLDFGCGMGNLAIQAARRGCSVVALDASHTAIEHLRFVARRDDLAIKTKEVDLLSYEITENFDAVACIGLLMFFDCPSAYHQLSNIQACVRPGGVAAVNVLVEGTTYMDMFSPEGHCLFKQDELRQRFKEWELLSYDQEEFSAPANTRKVFVTLIARKPETARADANPSLKRKSKGLRPFASAYLIR